MSTRTADIEWYDVTGNHVIRPSRAPATKDEWFQFFDTLMLLDPRTFDKCVRNRDSACHKYFNNSAYIGAWKQQAELYREERLNGS